RAATWRLTGAQGVQFAISDFGSEVQDSSNFNFPSSTGPYSPKDSPTARFFSTGNFARLAPTFGEQIYEACDSNSVRSLACHSLNQRQHLGSGNRSDQWIGARPDRSRAA